MLQCSGGTSLKPGFHSNAIACVACVFTQQTQAPANRNARSKQWQPWLAACQRKRLRLNENRASGRKRFVCSTDLVSGSRKLRCHFEGRGQRSRSDANIISFCVCCPFSRTKNRRTRKFIYEMRYTDQRIGAFRIQWKSRVMSAITFLFHSFVSAKNWS